MKDTAEARVAKIFGIRRAAERRGALPDSIRAADGAADTDGVSDLPHRRGSSRESAVYSANGRIESERSGSRELSHGSARSGFGASGMPGFERAAGETYFSGAARESGTAGTSSDTERTDRRGSADSGTAGWDARGAAGGTARSDYEAARSIAERLRELAPGAKRVGVRLCFLLLGVLFGGARCLFDTRPIGIALLAASGGQTLFVFSGILISVLIRSGDMLSPLVSAVTVLAVRLLLSRLLLRRVDESDGEGAELSERLGIPLYSERAAFTERPLLRLVSAVAGAIAGGAVRLFSYGMLYYDAFALLFSVGASAALCVAFSVLGNREKRFTVYYEAALLAGVFCLVWSMREYSIFGFRPAVMAAFFVTLIISRSGGLLHGGLAGMACGLGIGLEYAPVFAVGGIACALFNGAGGIISTAAAALASIGMQLGAEGIGALSSFVPDALAAAVLSVPVIKYKLLPRLPFFFGGRSIPDELADKASVALCRRGDMQKREEELTAAFGSLAEACRTVSGKDIMPTQRECYLVCVDALDSCCRRCPSNGRCFRSPTTAANAANAQSDKKTIVKPGINSDVSSGDGSPETGAKGTEPMGKITAVSTESGSAAAASHRDEPHAGDAVYCMAGAVAETAAPSVGTSRIGSRYGGVDESEGLCELLGARLRASGALSESDMPESLRERCTCPAALAAAANLGYARLVRRLSENDKTRIFAEDYEAISTVLRECAEEEQQEYEVDRALSARVREAVGYLDFHADSLTVFGKRRLRVVAGGVDLGRVRVSPEELHSVCEHVTGRRLSVPVFSMEEDYVCMSSESVPSVCADGVTRSLEKKDEQISGDSTAFFTVPDGMSYMLISDGMGSGREAATASRIAVEFLRRMLGCGIGARGALDLLNNFIRHRREECFATVDLLQLDGLSGQARLIKSGAAPSFVIRDGSIFRISSGTIPVGIAAPLSSEQVRFTPEDGDVIVMMSDGVAQSLEDCAYLADLIIGQWCESLPELAERILSGAAERSGRRDDMTVGLCRVRHAER